MKIIPRLQRELENIYRTNIYNWDKKKRIKLYNFFLYNLNKHHYLSCDIYQKITDVSLHDFKSTKIEELPFLPIEIFKKYSLSSLGENTKFNYLLSSGTSGQRSKIVLDRITSINQSKTLLKILSSYFGEEKYSLLIIDRKFQKGDTYSASNVGMLGCSLMALEKFYCYDKNNKLNEKEIKAFIKSKNKKKIVFGFTSKVWAFFNDSKFLKKQINFNGITLVHGGGWKKMKDSEVSKKYFDETLKKKYNFLNILNYYGLVEQTGSIFFQCKLHRHFHTTIFSDIIIRDKNFISVNKKKGIVQLISLLPFSYPGHNILTQDVGEIIGEDNCSCGIKGKYFKIYGRVQNSEIRGCSDSI